MNVLGGLGGTHNEQKDKIYTKHKLKAADATTTGDGT